MIPDNFKYQYCLKLININRMARRLGIETETERERKPREKWRSENKTNWG